MWAVSDFGEGGGDVRRLFVGQGAWIDDDDLTTKLKSISTFSLHLQCAAQNGCNVRLTISHFNDINTCARQRSVHVRMFTYKALAAASFSDDEPRDLGAVLFPQGPHGTEEAQVAKCSPKVDSTIAFAVRSTSERETPIF